MKVRVLETGRSSKLVVSYHGKEYTKEFLDGAIIVDKGETPCRLWYHKDGLKTVGLCGHLVTVTRWKMCCDRQTLINQRYDLYHDHTIDDLVSRMVNPTSCKMINLHEFVRSALSLVLEYHFTVAQFVGKYQPFYPETPDKVERYQQVMCGLFDINY